MPTFHRFAALLAALFVLGCSTALAQTTIHVPADQPTIQAGINAAANGDTVLVAPGTYYENIDFKGKAITVTSSGGAATTIIDGQRLNPTVVFVHHETAASVISNFTITGGQGSSNGSFSIGGIYVNNSGPSIVNNIITGNQCYGVNSLLSHPLIQNNVISNTQAQCHECGFASGAGIYINNGGYPDPVSPVVIGNVIELNTHSGIDSGGENPGAGIAVWYSKPVIESNIIRNNASGRDPSAAGGGEGGGLYYQGAGGLLIQNLIYGNTSNLTGGGIALDLGISNTPALAIINNTIVDNAVIQNGQAPLGGQQIFVNSIDDSFILVNNIIGGSTPEASFVCGDYTSSTSLGTIPATPPIYENNDIYNNAGPAVGTYQGAGCVDPKGTYGNISADPQFVQPSTANYHLRSTSPAIDAGNDSAIQLAGVFGASPTLDLDGNPRIQNTLGKAFPVIDMGVYEFAGTTSPNATTVVLTPSAYEVAGGAPITLTAQLLSLSGIPTGNIQFTQDGSPLNTAPINGSGSAQISTNGLTPGLHSFVAVYSGQGVFTPANSVHLYIFVDKYSLTLTLVANPNPANVGQPVQFTVSATYLDNFIATPIVLTDNTTGTILGSLTPDASGNATLTTSTLSVGTHYISASFAGDQLHSSGTVYLNVHIVNPFATAIVLTGSPNPSLTGQSVTFSATITSANGTPAGSVQFTDNGTNIGTQTLNASGVATLSTSTLSVGTHNITATYTPTGSFAGSSTSITQTVNDITNAINLTSSLNPSTYGQPVTITAHVVSLSGVVPAGSFAFSDGGQFLSRIAADTSGNAAITLSTLSVGAHIITGAFTPNSSPHTSAGTLTQQVNGLATSTLLTATPITGVAHITPITLTATVAPAAPGGPTPTGQVLFYLNGAQLNLATLVNGVATYTGTLPAGVDQIYAAYVGDPTHIYNSSNSNTVSVTITAAPSTLSLTSSLNPAPALTPFTVSAQLGIPGSTQPGAGYPISITIAPTATAQSTTNASGTATYTSTGLLPGQYLVTATFAGTTDLQPSTATSFVETITANPTATTLTASPNPGIQNNPVTFTSTVSALAGTASPTGTVTIYDSLSPNTAFTAIATLALPSAAGTTTATFTTSALAPGTHILYAAFTPAAGFAPSQSAQFTLVIEPQSFTLTLSDPTLTVQTGHHRSETATLTSIGGLTGTFSLSCGTLPLYASCAWGQGSVTLPANGTVSTSVTIDTDQLLGFLASNTRPTPNPGAPFMARFLRHEWAATTAFTLFPLTLLGFRRRRNLRSLLPLFLLAALASTLTACGANQYPYSTTPGTYTVHITAAGPPAPGGVSPTQTVDLTLVVAR